MIPAEESVRRPFFFSLDELRYEYPEEIVPPGETPASQRPLLEAVAKAIVAKLE